MLVTRSDEGTRHSLSQLALLIGDIQQHSTGAAHSDVHKFLDTGHPPVIDNGINRTVQGHTRDISKVPAVPNEGRVITVCLVIAVIDAVLAPPGY